MRMQEKWILAASTALVVAILAGAIPAAGQECVRLTDGTRSLSLPLNPAPEGPACREPGPVSLAELNPVDDEPVPSDRICNCTTFADCKPICGDRGGHCGVYLACEIPPYKHTGTCFCDHQAGATAVP
jgi:hypothetical protein